MKMKLTHLPLLFVMVACTSCHLRETPVHSPLVWKYLGMHAGVSVVKLSDDEGRQEPYALWWRVNDPPKRTPLTWENEGIYLSGEIEYRRYPELTRILADAGVVVSNAFVARDIRDLFDVVMKPENFITRRDYLVEDVARTGNVWVVEARYWGSPDDWHRRPSKVVCKIMVSDSNTIQDVIEEVHLRPMDTEEWKRRTKT